MAGWQRGLIGAPTSVRKWLADRDSLTRRLRAHCAQFGVGGVRQYRGPVLRDELGMIDLGAARTALVREVRLQCADRMLVFAHSVLPHASLVGDWKRLGRLGKRPLGERLFADVRVRRAGLQFCRLNRRHPLYERAASAGQGQIPARLWARRSLFARGKRRILVTELFLPALWHDIDSDRRV